MPYVNINHVLEEELLPGNQITLGYPEGVNQGSFFGVIDHTLSIESRFFRSPRDFLIIPAPENIILHWTANIKVPKGLILNIQLKEQGGDFFTDKATGVTVKGMVNAPTFFLNLGSVKNRDQNHYFEESQIADSGKLALIKERADVPRNVTIHSNDDETGLIFTIHGEDCYLKPMTEEIKGPTTGISNGKKAFTKIHKITASGPSKGSVSIGIGNRLGLPVFVPAPGNVMREMVNGMSVTGGMLVPGELNVPNASTGDRRGTYTPPPSVSLNGKDTIQLFLILPNPGNIGTPDYAEA